jgi:hypothetical protein
MIKIVGPKHLDDSIKDFADKGVLPSVILEVEGKLLDICVISPNRLMDEVNINIDFNGAYMIPANYIVVKGDINRDIINNVMKIVAGGEDFKNLVKG